jgi:hypothetical protein
MGIIILLHREHLQPLLRYHHYSLGVQIHVAGWPMFPSADEGAPLQQSADLQALVTRFASIEGQMFVICTNQVQSPAGAKIMG